MLTVLPDLYLIWKTQRQMVADIFALYGRTAELTRTHMLYCLFRHAASQVLRDVVGAHRAARRRAAAVGAARCTTVARKVGVAVSQARRRHGGEPLDAAGRRGRRRRVRVLGHAAGGEDRARLLANPDARPTPKHVEQEA